MNRDPFVKEGKRMKKRFAPALLASLAVIAPLAAIGTDGAFAQTVSRPSREIVLSIGKGQLVSLPAAMKEVWVANETIADVQVKSASQLYVFGKAPGETTLYASDAHGKVIWSATLRVGSNMDSIDDMLRLAMPDAKVHVNTMNGTVLLTGTIAAPEDAAEAERLTKAFVGDKVNVISRLRTATPLQVNLQVRFAEVNRSLSKTINSNLTTINGNNGFQYGIGQGRGASSYIANGQVLTGINPNSYSPYPLGVGNNPSILGYDPAQIKYLTNGLIDPNSVRAQLPGTSVATAGSGLATLALKGNLFGLGILAALDLGEQIGLSTTLAQPNLTALSGETATFLAGGEYPIPVSNGLGTTTIQFKKYGVSLAYTPTVLANGRISLRVAPEVSELTNNGAVTINGFTVPALSVRKAETTIELGSGQSFMIAGLLSNNANNTIQKTPGAGDLPILGSLFRSTNFQKGQTELVIVVTPYLVNPVDANDIKLPTDGYSAPNELQRILGNQLQNGKSGGDRPKPSEKPGTVQSGTGQPGPQVGLNDQPVALPAQAPAQVADNRRSKPDKQAAKNGSGATPGFDLK
ncbi:type II and III secretion system protein family protein [Novosphingobium sp.]|uniref:type II and III secretion system protein family protein n=1 Tax=Novosphingobium sp. TaxID=1874826 RepID=UPI0025D1E96A|nr:type II and III secretion system protein family protein [Novosphingobium sp.]